MRVEMVKCDNPECQETGVPEFVKPEGERKRKSDWPEGVSPPYAWIYGWMRWMGSGPDIYIVVHNISCATPALEAKYKEARRLEMGYGT